MFGYLIFFPYICINPNIGRNNKFKKMVITKERLLENGFEERMFDGHTVFLKGHHALVYVFGVWLPCRYGAGTILSDRLYINTMEELEILENL